MVLSTTIIGCRSPHKTPTKQVVKIQSKYERVLDIGCGNGRNFIFPLSVGIDADLRILNRTRKRGTCLCADGQHLPFRENVFDLALFCYSLEFMKEQKKAWCDAERVAKDVFHLVAPSKYTWNKVHSSFQRTNEK